MSTTNPFDSLLGTLTGSSRDQSLDRRDAWLYGIVVGWDAASLAELAPKHGWTLQDVERLQLLHQAFAEHAARAQTPETVAAEPPGPGLTYTIHLSETQLGVYTEALDFYSRFVTGDVRALPDTLRLKRYDSWQVNPLLDQLKREIFPDLRQGAHYGIGRFERQHVGYHGQVAYEMQREARHLRAKQRAAKSRLGDPDDGFFDIYLGETLKYSDQPLPVVYVTHPTRPAS